MTISIKFVHIWPKKIFLFAICKIYYSFPCVPHKSSKLNKFFLAFSLKSSDVKKYNNKCFTPLIGKLKKLEGREIKTREGTQKSTFYNESFTFSKVSLVMLKKLTQKKFHFWETESIIPLTVHLTAYPVFIVLKIIQWMTYMTVSKKYGITIYAT